jgi:hypothetical protein
MRDKTFVTILVCVLMIQGLQIWSLYQQVKFRKDALREIAINRARIQESRIVIEELRTAIKLHRDGLGQ